MKKPFNCLSIFLLLFVFSANYSFGCSTLKAIYKFSKVNPYQFKFVGKVVGYTESVKFKDYKTHGLKIEVSGNISSPENLNNYYEVFPITICNSKGYSTRDLKKNYPIDSEVRVIALQEIEIKDEKAHFFTMKNNLGQIRLRSNYILRNDSTAKYKSSADSIFYYYSQTTDEKTVAFEINKDLLKLENADSENIKLQILKRLIYYPYDDLDFEYLVKSNITNSQISDNLIKERKVKVKPVGTVFYKFQ